MKCLCAAFLILCAVFSSASETSSLEFLTGSFLRSEALSPIRLHFELVDFDLGSSEANAAFNSTLLGAVQSFLQATVHVHALEELLVLGSVSSCGVAVPATHREPGIAADLIIYLTTVTDKKNQASAFGEACVLQADGRNNVLTGQIILNAKYFPTEFAGQFTVLLHEIMHVLAFASTLFPYFHDAAGELYSQVSIITDVRGVEKTLLTTPTVVETAQTVLGITGLQGVELEENDNTSQMHWDMRVAYYDLMTVRGFQHPFLSSLSFALLQDTGWYEIHWEYTQAPLFGQGEGELFLSSDCIVGGTAAFPEFCDQVEDMCDFLRLSKGYCNLVEWQADVPEPFQYFENPRYGGMNANVDYCPVVVGYAHGDCRTGTQAYQYYGETICNHCRCLAGTLVSEEYAEDAVHTGCYEVVECLADRAVLRIGGQSAECPFAGGRVQVTGFNGYLDCPSSDILCADVPCVNHCYGRGACVQGVCHCAEGWGGHDCSLVCDKSVAGVTECYTECPSGFTLDSSQCLPPTTPVIAYILNTQLNVYSGEFPLFLGDSESFLPDYDSHDPIAVYGQGLYFHGNSYSLLPPNAVSDTPLILAPTHSVELWAKPQESGGYLFSHTSRKEVLSLFVSADFRLTATALLAQGTELEASLPIAADSWTRVAYSIEHESDTTLFCVYAGTLHSCSTARGDYYVSGHDTYSVVGARGRYYFTDFFVGFIATLSVTNGFIGTQYEDLCLYPNQGVCLVNCNFNQTVEEDACVDCSCPHGCVRTSDCVLNADALCMTYTDWFGCITCEDLARFNEDSECECVDNAHVVGSSCECVDGYQPFEGKCSLCKPYFKSSELSASFSEDFSSISIKFSEAVGQLTYDCSVIFLPSSLQKLGTAPLCTWTNSNKLTVKLGSAYTLDNEFVSLDPDEIWKANAECSYEHSALQVKVQLTAEFAAPVAVISAPDLFSLECGSLHLVLSAIVAYGTYKSPATYAWSVDRTNSPELIDFLITQSSPTVFIPSELLTNADYTFNLTVTNKHLLSSTSLHTVAVSVTPVVSVIIDAGSAVTMKVSESRNFKALIPEFCGSQTAVTYSWRYMGAVAGAPPINSAKILSNSAYSHILQVNPRDLVAGYTYEFRVFVHEGNVIGDAQLRITVQASDLVALIMKPEGSSSSARDLVIDASRSYDPDHSSESIRYKWTCYELTTECIDAFGDTLRFDAYNMVLRVPKELLRIDAIYSFKITVSKGERVAEATVTTRIVGAGDYSMNLEDPIDKVKAEDSFLVNVLVKGTQENSVQWTQAIGPRASPSTPLHYSFLGFNPHSLQPGFHYSWKFEYSSDMGQGIESKVFWDTNQGPACLDSARIEPTSGKAFSTVFTIYINDCFDLDDQDYPLSYSIGAYLPERSVLHGTSYSSYIRTQLPAGTHQLFIEVCDALFSCNEWPLSVTVDTTSASPSFAVFTRAPEQVPLGIFLFQDESSAPWEEQFAELSEYVNSTPDTNPITAAACAASLALLENETQQQVLDKLQLLGDMLEFTDLQLNQADFELVLSSMDSALSLHLTHSEVLEALERAVSLFYQEKMDDTPPYSPSEELAFASLAYRKERTTPEVLRNYTSSVGNFTVRLPEHLPLTGSAIVNFVMLTYFPTNSSTILEIRFTESGEYTDLLLSLKGTEHQLFFTELPMFVEFPVSDTGPWECRREENTGWVTEGCSIVKESADSYTVQVTRDGKYTLVNVPEEVQSSQPESCESSLLPILLALLLLLTAGSLRILVYLKRKKLSQKEQAPISEVKSVNVSTLYPEDSEGKRPEPASRQQLFFKHHLVLGQTQPYYTGASTRILLLVGHLSQLFIFSGLLTSTLAESLGDFMLLLSGCAAILSSCLILALDILLQKFRRGWVRPAIQVYLVSMAFLCTFYCFIHSLSSCTQFGDGWMPVLGIAVAGDLVILQSSIAAVKTCLINPT